MRDTATIQAINCEQLATATDRLLLRGRRVSKHRPSTRSPSPGARGYLHVPLSRGSQSRIAHPAPPARGSQPYITPPARGSQPYLAPLARAAQPFAQDSARASQTMVVRKASRWMPQMFALSVAVPALVGIAIGIAALL
jgi:hypothetical protein